MKIGTQLRLGLSVIILLVMGLAAMSWRQTTELSARASDMYEHPLMVRSAVGALKADILAVENRLMDLAVSDDEHQRSIAIREIATAQQDAERQLDELSRRYLGPASDIAGLRQTLRAWNDFSTETLRLLTSGQRAAAVRRISPDATGDSLLNAVLSKHQVIDTFARAKAEQFRAESAALSDALHRALAVAIGLLVLLCLVVAVQLSTALQRPMRELMDVTQAFRDGRRSVRSRHVGANEFGALGASFNAMADVIEAEMAARERAASLSAVMLRESEMRTFCREVLKGLLEQTRSQMGAIYVLNDAKSQFELFDAIGLAPNARTSFSAAQLEGEFGVALATKRIARITDIPPDAAYVLTTATGDLRPREILTIPLPADQSVSAIISLASVHGYDATALRLVDDLWGVLTARVNGVLAFREIQSLATRLEQQNRELDAQKRELTAQSDELTHQNAELVVQKQELNEANRLKSAFLSNMSHELRTPLNSVIALSGVLNRRLASRIPAEEGGYLEIIERNGKNLLALINDILDLSRIEAGRADVTIVRFSVCALVSEIFELLEPQLMGRPVTLRNLVARDLPLVASDPDKLRHILQNLVGNAIKFTTEGRVDVSAAVDERWIAISVTDTGIGIAPMHLPHIFDEFRQADDSTARRFGGTGLGLAIAQKYAALLGGTLAVESVVGKGSTFTLKLPLASPVPASSLPAYEASPRRQASQPGRAPELHGGRILVVEDNESAIIQLTDILSRAHYEVQVARDGAEALARIEQAPPDAIILDLMMPGVDGFQVLQALRASARTRLLPVLILTAKHVTKEELSTLKGNHVFQLIQKGDVNKNELLNAVACMLTPPDVATPSPLAPASSAPTSSAPAPVVVPRLLRDGKPVILVVDDNADNRLTTKALLQDAFVVLEAEDGADGVAQAKTHRPDLVLMDVAMPGLDGFAALQAIRAFDPLRSIPVLALTARAMRGDRETILAQGFDGYVPKPVDSAVLLDALHAALA